ncbi:histidine phosphatase family protein [Cronobacter turicensis]
MNLLLIRHAETEWNRGGLIQGRQDSALTARGVHETTALLTALVHEFPSVDAVYTSPAGRARHMGNAIASHFRCHSLLSHYYRSRHSAITKACRGCSYSVMIPPVQERCFQPMRYLRSLTETAAKAGQTTVENNLLRGGTDDGQVKAAQEHAKNIMSCADDPGSEPSRKGKALQNAIIVALPADLGWGMLIAATSELAAAAQVAIRACAGNVVLCLNNAGIMTSEAIVPGGVGAGGAIGIGKTTLEATTAKAEAEAVAANAAKNNPSWKAGEYLEDFKPSPTPRELIREQGGKGSQTANIRRDHILNGEVKTLKDGTKVGSGGNYICDSNIKIDKVTGAPDANGVSTGYISVRDPATGQ